MSEQQPYGSPSSLPAPMPCPHCGGTALHGSLFCPLCGKKLPALPPATAPYCPHCGTKTIPSGSYCTLCGKLIPSAEQQENRPKHAKKPAPVMALVLAILLSLSLLANVWLAAGNSSLLSRYLSAHDDLLYLNRYLVFVSDGEPREYHSYDCRVWAQMRNYTRYYMTVEDAKNLDYSPCPLCR